MEKLHFKGSEETPTIIFDRETPEFLIKGKSFMEDVLAYYEPVINWLEEYKKDPLPVTACKIEVEYINTASSKMFLDVVGELNDIYLDGFDAKIEWYYFEDDEDMESTGKEFSEMFEIPIKFIMVK